MGNQLAACCTSDNDAYYLNIGGNDNRYSLDETCCRLESSERKEDGLVGVAAREAASRKAAHMAVLDNLPENHVDSASDSDLDDVASSDNGMLVELQQNTLDELLVPIIEEELQNLLAAGYSSYDAIMMLKRKLKEQQEHSELKGKDERKRDHNDDEEEEHRLCCEEEAELLAKEEQRYRQQQEQQQEELVARQIQEQHFRLREIELHQQQCGYHDEDEEELRSDEENQQDKEDLEQDLTKQEWLLEVAQEREYERIRALEEEEELDEQNIELEQEDEDEYEHEDGEEEVEDSQSQIESQENVSLDDEEGEEEVIEESDDEQVSVEEEAEVEEERLDD